MILGQQPNKSGSGNPSWKFLDWTPPASFGQVAQHRAPAAATATPAPAPTVSAPADWQYTADGGHRWRPGMANWEPVPVQAPPPPPFAEPPPPPAPAQVVNAAELLQRARPAAAQTPPMGVAQAIPPTETVTGGDGEGGQVTMTRAAGAVRQAVYRPEMGPGVVQQPSGGLTQAPQGAAPSQPASQAPQAPPPAPTQPPAPAAQAGAPAQALPGTVTVQVTHDDCGESLTAVAYRFNNMWMAAHRCNGKPVTLNVDAEANAALAAMR